MSASLDARVTFMIVAIVVAIAVGLCFGAWAAESASSSGPCQMLYGMYCVGTVTTYYWCFEPAPCPNVGNSTVVLGYTFNVWPMVLPNGTPALSVSILGLGASGTGNLLLSNPIGAPVDWTSSDGHFLVLWANPPPSWETPPPPGAKVICGVAGP